MYLTNRSDYAREDPTAIADVLVAGESKVTVTTLTGVVLRRNMARSQALRGLPAGVYIVDGTKVMVSPK